MQQSIVIVMTVTANVVEKRLLPAFIVYRETYLLTRRVGLIEHGA